MRKLSYLLILISLCFISCNKDDDNSSSDDLVKDFIWVNMDYYYLWTNQMPSNVDKGSLTPEKYFDALLYKPTDRWSFITDDYDALKAAFQGTGKNMGWDLRLMRYGANGVIGAVGDVIPGSPAAKAGVERGDVIHNINGVELNLDNYSSLLGKENMTVSLGRFKGEELYTHQKTKTLSAVEMFTPPVFMDSVYNINNKKIAYLGFRSFLPETAYLDLENSFTKFNQKGATELILDMRYNSGGYITVANHLASLIVPSQSKGDIFTKQVWNHNMDELLKAEQGSEYNILRFMDKSQKMNLTKVYILTTGLTASASELVINGLRAFMDVVVIGTKTSGKYTGSVTIYDEKRRHNWAMQPIVLKSANADGVSDYGDGLAVNYQIDEGFADNWAYKLGDVNESLLNKALSLISGKSLKSTSKTVPPVFETIGLGGRNLPENGMISNQKIPLQN